MIAGSKIVGSIDAAQVHGALASDVTINGSQITGFVLNEDLIGIDGSKVTNELTTATIPGSNIIGTIDASKIVGSLDNVSVNLENVIIENNDISSYITDNRGFQIASSTTADELIKVVDAKIGPLDTNYIKDAEGNLVGHDDEVVNIFTVSMLLQAIEEKLGYNEEVTYPLSDYVLSIGGGAGSSIDASQVEGSLTLATIEGSRVNGNIVASQVSGSLTNAVISIEDVDGNIPASRVYGSLINAEIDASDVYGELDASQVAGSLTNAYIEASRVSNFIDSSTVSGSFYPSEERTMTMYSDSSCQNPLSYFQNIKVTPNNPIQNLYAYMQCELAIMEAGGYNFKSSSLSSGSSSLYIKWHENTSPSCQILSSTNAIFVASTNCKSVLFGIDTDLAS